MPCLSHPTKTWQRFEMEPRACLVDVIKASPMGALFKPDNLCFGASGAGNNWYAPKIYVYAHSQLIGPKDITLRAQN